MPAPLAIAEPVTLHDIARAAGVSVQVASRALNGVTKGVRRDAAARADGIREVAARLGYRRNIGAAAMRGKQFGCLTLVLSADHAERSNLPQDMLVAITDALEEHGMHLSLARMTDAAIEDDARLPRLLRDYGADALLINYNKWVPPRLEQIVAAHALPAVWINDRRAADAVFPDDLEAGRTAAMHLLALCHRRIAYLGHPASFTPAHYSESDRREGYAAALRRASLAPECFQGPHPLVARLRAPSPPTAIVAYNTRLASDLLLLAAEAGLQCPRDFSLVAFGTPLGGTAKVLSTLAIPNAQVGRLSVEMALRKLANHSQTEPAVSVPFALRDGETCAACRNEHS